MKHNQSHSLKVIAIDPGKSGGLCVVQDDFIEAKKCPSTVHDMSLLFALAINETPPEFIRVVLEKVWARPHDGRSSIFTFAGNYGQWEGIIASHEMDIGYVTPQAWMKACGIPKKMTKKDRKNYIKDLAKKLYPKLGKKVTLATADAIVLAHYGQEKYNNIV